MSILTRLIYFKYRLTLSYKKLVEFDQLKKKVFYDESN
uniref:Uncharacterized protein n=1 Tax=Siphoviridae sp. ctWdm1 TaxID=2827883 RepID=A0A8S5RXW6_9CAUD|nr:MAG TPA: hypothetical protein [Siphoviridae sp. ctWdm1]DAV67635.1 MAG TPA: hypothetical protein [Caudoviricetes sp.]